MNSNTLLLTRLSRLVIAAGIGNFAFLGLLLFFTPYVRHVQAAPPPRPLAALCSTPIVTLTPAQDTWLDENAANDNHGDESDLHTKPALGDLSRSLIEFDLSSIPTKSAVTCATLRVHVKTGQSSQTVHIHRVTNGWNEVEATWNDRLTGTPWAATNGGGDFNPTEEASFQANVSGVYRDIDITSLVQFWVDNPGSNFGLLLRSTDTGNNGSILFDSRETPDTPQLLVEYNDKPRLSLDKTSNSNLVKPGDTITYTIVVSNIGIGEADSAVISDSLPANTNFVANSISLVLEPTDTGTPGTTPPILATGLNITPGNHLTVTFAVSVSTQVTSDTVITNTAEIVATELGLPSIDTFTHTVTLSVFNPVMLMDMDGPISANVDETVTLTYTLLNLNSGDGSPISNIVVTDPVAGTANFVGGDFIANGMLEPGEAWLYTATYTIKATDPNPLISVAIAQGQDEEGDPISAIDSHRIIVIGAPLFLPTILKNA